MSGPVELLGPVLAKTEDLISEVRPDQSDRPTPCPDYDVAGLVDHLVGAIRAFAASSRGQPRPEPPDAYRGDGHAAEDFHVAAAEAVTAFEQSADPTLAGIMLIEAIGHGWDLAIATDQSVPYTEAEADAALRSGRQMLKPAHRGAGMPFGEIVAVPEAASTLERLIGFLGRSPQ